MRAPTRLASVISVVVGFTCAPSLGAQVKPPAELKLHEVWSTEGKVVADGLTTITGLAEAADSRIWILDAWPTQGRILVLDPETMSAEVVGRLGDGPGEVRFPTDIAITPNGRVAVYDLMRRGVEIYESSGEPFRRVQLRGAAAGFGGIVGFAAPASGGFLVSAYSASDASAIHHFDDEGNWVRGWRERYPPRSAFPGSESITTVMMAQQAGTGGWVHALPNGSFLYSQFAPHEIVRFDISPAPENGWVARPVVSIPDLFEEPGATVVQKTTTEDGRINTRFTTTWPHSMAVFQMPNGNILNVVDLGEEERWLWQVFDTTGTTDGTGAVLVAEASLDREYIPQFLCENGDLLATAKDANTDVYYAVRLRLDFRVSPTTTHPNSKERIRPVPQSRFRPALARMRWPKGSPWNPFSNRFSALPPFWWVAGHAGRPSG